MIAKKITRVIRRADNTENLYEVYAPEPRTLLTTMSEAEVEALLLRAEPNAGEVLARLRFGESEIVLKSQR